MQTKRKLTTEPSRMSVTPHFEGYEIIAGSGSGDGVVVGGARPGGVSAGGRLQLGDGQGGAGGLRGAAVLQRVLAVAAHDTPRHAPTVVPSRTG